MRVELHRTTCVYVFLSYYKSASLAACNKRHNIFSQQRSIEKNPECLDNSMATTERVHKLNDFAALIDFCVCV